MNGRQTFSRANRRWRRMLRRLTPCGYAALLALQVLGQQREPRPAFDAFEEAVIKPTHGNYQVSEGRVMAMQGAHRFTAQHYTLQALIAAAFDLNPRAILGGPEWL